MLCTSFLPSDGAAELLFFCLRTLAGKYSLSCFLYKKKTKQTKQIKTRKQHRYKQSQLQLNAYHSGKQKIAEKRFVTSKGVNLSPFSGKHVWWRLAINAYQKWERNFHFSYNFLLALSEAMISHKKAQKLKPKTNKVMLWKINQNDQ